MARRKKGARVLGPYADKGGWRVVAIDEEGNRVVGWYPTEEEAIEVAEEAERLKPGQPKVTIKKGIKDYEKHLKKKQQRKKRVSKRSKSVPNTVSRLENFIGKKNHERGIRSVTTALLRQRIIHRAQKVEFDTLTGDFGAACRWVKWCYKKGWIPAATVAGLDTLKEMDELDGEHNRGKPQLRIDEARKLLKLLLSKSGQAAMAVLCVLLLGLRSREILERVARDLDDDGWLLWIKRAKTRRSNRKVELTPELRTRMQKLAEGLAPGDPLFPARKRGDEPLKNEGFHYPSWLRERVQEFCVEAKVPVVCTQGLRGTHSSLAEAGGATAEVVAAALGHTSPKVTRDHYTMPDVADQARRKRALKVLKGGRR